MLWVEPIRSAEAETSRRRNPKVEEAIVILRAADTESFDAVWCKGVAVVGVEENTALGS